VSSDTPMAATGHVHRDDVGSRMGMWLFLFTELILFGGLFLVYAVYRFAHAGEFHLAATELDTLVGTVNTMILLTSSLTAAMSITAIQEGRQRFAQLLVGLTLLLALAFLVNKYFEWGHKFELGLYPKSPVLLAKTSGEILYFGLYYVMTGLHALHVIIGMVILAVMMRGIAKGTINRHSYVRLESGALYWHLVDVIWIFLFPLFYLLH
jgi:cytochrome c oxidase subunit III